MRTRREVLGGIILGSLTTTPIRSDDTTFGHFSGEVKVKWLTDGRLMQLLSPLLYTDPDGVQWIAKAGLKTDGATIPPFAWPFIGGPFEGKYRDAAVIHDAGCHDQNRRWEAVHLAFYNAMRCKEVEAWRAKVMYAAVYFFGPRWVLNPTDELPKRLFETEAEFFTLAGRIESGETKQPPDGTKAAFHRFCETGASNPFDTIQKSITCAIDEVNRAMRNLSTSTSEAASMPSLSLEQIRSYRP
jgi:hypothetical protein